MNRAPREGAYYNGFGKNKALQVTSKTVFRCRQASPKYRGAASFEYTRPNFIHGSFGVENCDNPEDKKAFPFGHIVRGLGSLYAGACLLLELLFVARLFRKATPDARV